MKKKYVDAGWPVVSGDEHPVTEFTADRAGGLSPFGETNFPVNPDILPYIHPHTAINR